MTICVAARYKNTVVISSDGLTSLEEIKLINITNDPKIYEFATFFIAMSGVGPISDCLQELKLSEWQETILETRVDVINFMYAFQDKFTERLKEGEDMPEYEFLIATKAGKIFWVLPSPSVFEIKDWWAIGSGSKLAIGSLASTFPKIKKRQDLQKAVNQAIKIACQYDQNCEAPISTECFDVSE